MNWVLTVVRMTEIWQRHYPKRRVPDPPKAP
jgi:hypothetical protein